MSTRLIRARAMAWALCLPLSLTLMTAPLHAHHEGDPSSSPLSSAVANAHLLGDGQVSLGYHFNLVLYPELSAAELESKVRALPGLGKIQTPEQSSTQALDFGFGAFGWMQLNLSLRSSRIQRLREGHMHGNGSYGSHEFGSPAGISNTELRLKFRLAEGKGWKAAALVGGSLPTGEDNALSDGVSASLKFNYLSPAYQPGGGGVQGSLGLAYSREWGLWALDSSSTVGIPAAYRTYKAGNSGRLGLGFGRLFGKEGHEKGLLSAEFGLNLAEPSNTDGRSSDDGGLSVTAGPRLRVPLGARATATLGAAFLLAKPAGLDPAPSAALNLACQALF